MKYKGYIAIDFDGTITSRNNFPEISPIRPYAKEVIAALRADGWYCYLWTCRTDKTLVKAINFLNENGIELDSYNKGPSTGSPKLIATTYIDDAAYPNHGYIDWEQVAKYFGVSY